MKNYININGKKTKISEETAKNLEEQFNKKPTPSDEVSVSDYLLTLEVDWDDKEEVFIKDEPEQKIFVNEKFANGSKFGESCVFIKCDFGSGCEFGSYCKLGSDCEFDSDCKFGSGCEFGSHCKFNSGCE